MPRLQLRAIRRRFGDTVALDGIDLDIEEGEFVAIVGRSGGGKSTLLNVIGLLDQADSGAYEIDGADTTAMSDDARARIRSDVFAFVFQGFHLLDRRPVIDSVELGLLYRGLSHRDRRERALDALRAVGLEERADDLASGLSGGQRQRVAIARAMATGAPVIVADEPTGNLDSRTSGEIVALLRARHEAGSTVVLVTHDEEIAAQAHRIIRIADGRVVGSAAGEHPEYATTAGGPPGRSASIRRADLWRDALASLVARASRSAGLVCTVATAVALTITTTGLAASAHAQVSDRFDRHANRSVTATWDASPTADDGEPVRPEVGSGDSAGAVRRIAAVEGVESVALIEDRGSTIVRATAAREALQAPIVALANDRDDALGIRVDWLHPSRRIAQGEVLVGARLAEQIGVDQHAPGAAIAVDDVDMPVAGIIDAASNDPSLLGAVVVAPHTTTAEAATRIRVLVQTGPGAAQQVGDRLAFAVDPRAVERIRVRVPTDPTTLRAEVESDVQTTLIAFTGVAVLAAIAALTNAMVLAVLERRAELGLRRAIGARRSHVRALVLAEAALLGLVGGAGGLVLGLSTILTITIARGWSPVLDPWALPLALVGGLAVGLLGGLAAAWRAARLDPQEALRL